MADDHLYDSEVDLYSPSPRHYDRNGKNISIWEWAELFESDRRVAQTRMSNNVTVSTIWLGMDHRFGDGPPLIFETMVFGGEHDMWQARYSTENEAIVDHDRVVRALKEGREP